MINKYEAFGILACVGIMSLALFLLRVDTNVALLSSIDSETQQAVIVSAGARDKEQAVKDALADSINAQGDMVSIIIDDVTVGEGKAVFSFSNCNIRMGLIIHSRHCPSILKTVILLVTLKQLFQKCMYPLQACSFHFRLTLKTLRA